MTYECKITIERPNGKIEVVDFDLGYERDIHRTHWQQMVVATREAGQGELLSYDIIVIETDADRKRAGRKAAEKKYDAQFNDGGDGYNPYRDQYETEDATPYHKTDDQAD